jgi:glycosyltransferase involved in cell wall biosynthesis
LCGLLSQWGGIAKVYISGLYLLIGFHEPGGEDQTVDIQPSLHAEGIRPRVSIVIPSLNEEKTIGQVIKKAKRTLEAMGLTYEIIVADNSTDRSPEIARSLGAKVVTPDRLGYGYAYLYAIRHASGEIIVMADADDTYDMHELPKLLRPILDGDADFVICSRLKGRILKGAMPWLHRYIGNPLITWLINTFYKVGVSDSQCGFRAIKRKALEELKLEAMGMEFATDMLIKARYVGLRIAEIPITYYPRHKNTESKLRSLKDGWRHIEYIITYTPKHFYIYPGIALLAIGIALMTIALLNARIGYSPGIHTSIIGGMATIIGYNILLLGAIADLTLARRLGQQLHPIVQKLIRITPSRSIAIGVVLILIGLVYIIFLALQWVESGYQRIPLRGENMIALVAVALGLEIILASFLIKLKLNFI